MRLVGFALIALIGCSNAGGGTGTKSPTGLDAPTVTSDTDTDTDADSDADVDTDADTDTDSDTDTDTDTDTDADTDPTGGDTTPTDTDTTSPTDTGTGTTGTGTTTVIDTGSPTDTGIPALASWNGTYLGTLTVDIDGTPVGLGAGNCSGDLTVVVDEAATPQITGDAPSISCTAYVGMYGNVTITGNLTVDPDAAGLLLGSVPNWGLVIDAWTGAFAGDTLDGTFSSSLLGVSWAGSFTATR